MKNVLKRGFTLVELLVVVLIIGILSSVALPQYQKAVTKARAAEVNTWINNAQKALDLYILANGPQEKQFFRCGQGKVELDNTDELDISFPVEKICKNFWGFISTEVQEYDATWNFTCHECDKYPFDVMADRINGKWVGSCAGFNSAGVSICQSFKASHGLYCHDAEHSKPC